VCSTEQRVDVIGDDIKMGAGNQINCVRQNCQFDRRRIPTQRSPAGHRQPPPHHSFRRGVASPLAGGGIAERDHVGVLVRLRE